MELWNTLTDWFTSENGQRVVFGAIIPFVAILVAGLVAAAIGRAATRKLVAQRDRETRASAVSALIAAGHSAARWHSQAPAMREHQEALANAADVQVRLLPLAGAGLAADWAAHELADMRTNSVSFSFQADQTLTEYRDRLVEWLHRPNKAKKLFAADLERWRYDEPKVDPVVIEQQKWAAEQFTSDARTSDARTASPAAAAKPAVPASAASAASAPAPTTPAPRPATTGGDAPTQALPAGDAARSESPTRA